MVLELATPTPQGEAERGASLGDGMESAGGGGDMGGTRGQGLGLMGTRCGDTAWRYGDEDRAWGHGLELVGTGGTEPRNGGDIRTQPGDRAWGHRGQAAAAGGQGWGTPGPPCEHQAGAWAHGDSERATPPGHGDPWEHGDGERATLPGRGDPRGHQAESEAEVGGDTVGKPTFYLQNKGDRDGDMSLSPNNRTAQPCSSPGRYRGGGSWVPPPPQRYHPRPCHREVGAGR